MLSEMIVTRVWKTFPEGGAPLVLMLAIAEAAGQDGRTLDVAACNNDTCPAATYGGSSTGWQLKAGLQVLSHRVDVIRIGSPSMSADSRNGRNRPVLLLSA